MNANKNGKKILCHNGEVSVRDGDQESKYPAQSKHDREAECDHNELLVLLRVFLSLHFYFSFLMFLDESPSHEEHDYGKHGPVEDVD